MPSLDFSDLLHELLATGSKDAIYAGVKALSKKDPASLSTGELDALNSIVSACPKGSQAAKSALVILKSQPHSFIADW